VIGNWWLRGFCCRDLGRYAEVGVKGHRAGLPIVPR
jgi:hypothetical protein